MPPFLFERVSLRQPVFDCAALGSMLAGTVVPDLDRAAKPEPRPLPLGIALLLIAVLSLALWAGVGLLLDTFIFG